MTWLLGKQLPSNHPLISLLNPPTKSIAAVSFALSKYVLVSFSFKKTLKEKKMQVVQSIQFIQIMLFHYRLSVLNWRLLCDYKTNVKGISESKQNNSKPTCPGWKRGYLLAASKHTLSHTHISLPVINKSRSVSLLFLQTCTHIYSHGWEETAPVVPLHTVREGDMEGKLRLSQCYHLLKSNCVVLFRAVWRR